MTLSLYQRLAISVTVVFACLLYLFYDWSNNLHQHSRFQAEQQLHLELAQHLADDNPLLKDGVYDKAALENLFHTLMLLGPAFEFYYLDPAGNILTYSADKNKIKRKKIDLAPVQTFIQQPGDFPLFGDDPRNTDRQKIFSAAPIYKDEHLQGYLYVIIGGEIYDSVFGSVKQDTQMFQQFMWLGVSLTLLLVLLLVLFRFFTSPIRALAEDIKAVKSVNFDTTQVPLAHWQQDSSNEVNQLGIALSDMVNKINHQLGLLNKNDLMRRELLAHLSHDLRTPLAAIQGYTEILSLKNATLAESERGQHIATITRNANQLKRLIDQIFELAHLEDGQVSVELETFAIGELAQDIVAKFAIKAQQKDIKLTLAPEHLDKFVYSDIAKLERVLSNLIDNAIRHTDAGGEIVLAIEHLQDKLSINVIDTGSGISDKELPYIFDARYRASNSLGAKHKHAGLGLAITKRLCQLLNTDISVKSQLGRGSTFSVFLQRTIAS